MTQNNNIESTYGKPFSVSIANAAADVVMNAEGLPKSTIIVSTEYNETTMQDIGSQSLIMTDPNGQPFMLTYNIIETNGLHNTKNPNAIKLDIDGVTLQTNEQGQLTFGLGSLVDNSVFSKSLNSLNVNSQAIERATSTRYGVVRLDGRTIKEQNGKIYVDTSALDLATQNTDGIVTGDDNTIKTKHGVLSVDTQKLQKASDANYGVAKVDGTTLISNEGVVSVDMNAVSALSTSSGEKTLKADGTSVVSSNGVLSIDTAKLTKASSTNYGVAQIDPSTLYVDNNGSLRVKNYSSIVENINEYETTINELVDRITYLQNTIASGSYGSQEPEIRHLTCDQTTATELVPPTYMQEPINMEMQHVYVSLNVITNCEFRITIDYQDDKNPTTQLDNINFNEEIQKFGVDALDYIWPSTGMKEKRIVLLFNVKNFLSSTEDQTAITKINISVAAEADNTKEKSILYSIIRYNSAWKEEDEEVIEEPKDQYEYYIDERESCWYMIRIKPSNESQNAWDQVSQFDPKTTSEGGYVEDTMPLYGKSAAIAIDANYILNALSEDPEFVFYLKGVYVNKVTGKSSSFFERIPIENFIVFYNAQSNNYANKLSHYNIYNFEWKTAFDTLYYQIRYETLHKEECKSENLAYFVDNSGIYAYSVIKQLEGSNDAWMYIANTGGVESYVTPGTNYKHLNNTTLKTVFKKNNSRTYNVTQEQIPTNIPVVKLEYSSYAYDSESKILTLNIGSCSEYTNVSIDAYMTIDNDRTHVGDVYCNNRTLYAAFKDINIDNPQTFILSLYGEFNGDVNAVYNTFINEYLLDINNGEFIVKDLNNGSVMKSVDIAIANVVSVFGRGLNSLINNQDDDNLMTQVNVYDTSDLTSPLFVIQNDLAIDGGIQINLETLSLEKFNKYNAESVTVNIQFNGKHYSDFYVYNVPVIRNIDSKFNIIKYDGFIVPQFTHNFDKYFNPYNYSINVKDNNGNFVNLNEKIVVQDSSVTLTFRLKYNNFPVTPDKQISVANKNRQ